MSKIGNSIIAAIDEALEKGLVDVPLPQDVQEIRRRTGLSQPLFAQRYHIPLPVLRSWEQGKRTPDATAQAYLRCISKAPDDIAGLIG
jgi:putative transcriptional regulator